MKVYHQRTLAFIQNLEIGRVTFLISFNFSMQAFSDSSSPSSYSHSSVSWRFLTMHSRSDSVAVFLYVFNICHQYTMLILASDEILEEGTRPFFFTKIWNWKLRVPYHASHKQRIQEHFSYPLSIPSSDLAQLLCRSPIIDYFRN